jgi:hypothetical protein
MRGVNPNASDEAIACVVRALARVLAHPITKVRKVTKRTIFFYEDAVLPLPMENAEPVAAATSRRIIPFPVPFAAAHTPAGLRPAAVILPFPSYPVDSSPTGFHSTRAPPAHL